MNLVGALNEAVVGKLDVAAAATKQTIDSIYKEWQIDKFPYFLKSCFMHKLSWELMKLKFQKKILASFLGGKQKFVISFTGR